MDQSPTPPVHNEIRVAGLIFILILLLTAIAAVGYYIWHGMNHTPAVETTTAPLPLPPESEPAPVLPTEAEKLEQLSQLRTNVQNLTREEKRARLEKVSP